MLFVELVEDRDLDLRGAVVQHREHHLAAAGHHDAHAGQHPAHPLQVALRLDPRQLHRHDLAHFVAPGVEQVAAVVVAQRRFFLGQLLVQVPRRDLGQFAGHHVAAVVAEQRGLVGAARGLLGRFHGGRHRGQHGGAIGFDGVERAGLDQGLDGATVDRVLADAAAEVEQVLERTAFLARAQDVLDRALPRALDRPQAVAHGARRLALFGVLVSHGLEAVAREIDVGRQHLDAVVLGVAAEDLHLVRVVHVGGHGGGQELGRVVGLEPGGLVRDQRVRGRVRLVEAVARELLHQVEQLDREVGVVALFLGALLEQFAVLGHFLGLFLAHGAAQQVGAAQRVAADDLRDQHHLFLVDDDPVGALERALQIVVEVVHRGAAVLAVDEVVHHARFQRPRTVQGQHGDDVFEGVGPQLLEQFLHAARFQLEHRGGVGVAQNLVGGRIVEAERHDVEVALVLVELAHVAHGPVQDGQVAQAQEVELDQAGGFDVVLVELRHRAVLLPRLAIQRAEVGELAGRDQHAAGVHADVARQAFERLGQVDQRAHFLFLLVAVLEGRFVLQGALERPGVHRVERDQLGQAIAEHVGHVQHPAGVAHHGLGAQRAEGGDLAHGGATVFFLDVVDDAFAVVLAEVDIEVGHRDPLGIQEALEQQVVADRIQVGDAERVRHQRTGARTPARADRHAVVLAPVDEVLHDQEVAGEAHLDDGLAFPAQAFVVLLALGRALGFIREQEGHALFQALFGQLHQVVVQRHAVGRGEVGQARLAQHQAEVAALGDLDRIGQRRGHVGKATRHFLGTEQVLFLAEAAHAARVGQDLAFGDANTGLVRLEFVFVQELHRVRGHNRQAGLGRQAHGGLGVGLVAVHAGALQLDVVAAREHMRPLARQGQRRYRVAGVQRLADVAAAATRQHDQAVLALQPFTADLGPALALVGQERARQQFAQVQVALVVAHQQQHAKRLGGIVVVAQPDVTAGDGLDARAARALVELDQAEQVRQIGQRDCRLAQLGDTLDEVGNAHDAIHHRKLGMDSQVDKRGRSCYGFGHRRNCT